MPILLSYAPPSDLPSVSFGSSLHIISNLIPIPDTPLWTLPSCLISLLKHGTYNSTAYSRNDIEQSEIQTWKRSDLAFSFDMWKSVNSWLVNIVFYYRKILIFIGLRVKPHNSACKASTNRYKNYTFFFGFWECTHFAFKCIQCKTLGWENTTR